ncbi:MAG: amidohydrolase [Chloroflexi bacterium]|nr:amidohydrolase [Chloroflexota bacterium]
MVAVETQRELRTPTRPAFIDCDFHPQWDSPKDLYPYLPKRWIEHIEVFGLRGRAGGTYPRFLDDKAGTWPPSGRRAASEPAFVRETFLDPERVAYAILGPLSGVGGLGNLDLAAAWASAVNDWQTAEWLDFDPRFRASIQVAVEDPPHAAAEIRRVAGDRRFVQVQFPGRPQEPMGRRKYWPIYEACEEYGLAIMSHAFGSHGQPITGTGWPSYYLDDHVGPAQAMQANIISLVVEGVFEHFPGLRLVSVENGFGWLPSLCWRLDTSWHLLKLEVPHLTRLPSDYIHEHVYLSTQPMEEPNRPRYFLQLLEHFGPSIDRLVFATDYPHWDADDPDEALPVKLPADLQRKLYFENAARLYNLA